MSTYDFDLVTVLASLPKGCYLNIGVEGCDDPTEEFIGATIIEQTPEDGWRDGAEQYRFDDKVHVAVSTSKDDPRFVKLMTDMVKRFVAERAATSVKGGEMMPKWISTPAAVYRAQELVNEYGPKTESRMVVRVEYGPEPCSAHIYFSDGSHKKVAGLFAVEIMQLMKREP
jgi:hypothetical protein